MIYHVRAYADELGNQGGGWGEGERERTWPTFPQLYREGELVGDLDIFKEEPENDSEFFCVKEQIL